MLSGLKQLQHLGLLMYPHKNQRTSRSLIVSVTLPHSAKLLLLDLSGNMVLLPAWVPRLQEMSGLQTVELEWMYRLSLEMSWQNLHQLWPNLSPA